MDVKLVSRDPDLQKLCREILSELPNSNWNLITASPGEPVAGSDLHLWDYQPDLVLPRNISWVLSRHLFLLHRKDLPIFRESLGAQEANILLKPVTRATLKAFLGLAVSAHEDRVSTASSLRADRDEMLQCLIQANLKLQEYDQDRTNFLARAVHDFRAPLTAISGYCGLLLSEPLGSLNEDQKEVIQRMQHSAKRLSRMSDAMFQLSVGRYVKRRPDLQKAEISDCVEQALHEITPFADGKRISISVDLSEDTLPLYFESGQIEQVLVNLLDNGCKFTPKEGSIEIRGYPYLWERRHNRAPVTNERRRRQSPLPNSYRVDIRGSGPLIAPEHLEGIFEEYTSYSGGQDRSGGGLGLAICRMIITEHEGQVWVENTEQGPMFSFALPLHTLEPGQSLDTKDTNLDEDSKFLEVV